MRSRPRPRRAAVITSVRGTELIEAALMENRAPELIESYLTICRGHDAACDHTGLRSLAANVPIVHEAPEPGVSPAQGFPRPSRTLPLRDPRGKCAQAHAA